MSAYKFTARAVGSPDALQKPLVRKRAHSGGESWMKVTWEPARQAKKPCIAGSQHPACTHKEHQILTSAKATAFSAQYWDRKVHPTKASQQEFLPHALMLIWKKTSSMHSGTSTLERGGIRLLTVRYHGARRQIVEFPAVCSKIWSPAPPNPYISETAFSHRFQKVYTPPPPPRERYFGASEGKFKNSGKMPKPTELAHNECPREIS